MGVKGIKGIGVPKSFFKRFCYDLTGFDTAFSEKKNKINFIFVIFDVLFVDAKNILDNYRSRGFPFHEKTTIFK